MGEPLIIKSHRKPRSYAQGLGDPSGASGASRHLGTRSGTSARLGAPRCASVRAGVPRGSVRARCCCWPGWVYQKWGTPAVAVAVAAAAVKYIDFGRTKVEFG